MRFFFFFFGSINVSCHDDVDDDDDDVYLKALLNMTPLREFIFHNFYVNIIQICKDLPSVHQLPNSNQINH